MLFTAWDGSTYGEEMGDVALPWCHWCGGTKPLARDFSVFYIDKEDCAGGPVITTAKETDQCGVCGGDGTSCLDCNNVVNGAHVLDCDICHASQQAATAGRFWSELFQNVRGQGDLSATFVVNNTSIYRY